MAKQRRGAASRSPTRSVTSKSSPKFSKSSRSSKSGKPSRAPKPLTLAKKSKVSAPADRLKAKPVIAAPEPVQAAPPAPPRRPAFYEALAIYETGVRALQRHDFGAAADSLRGVIQRYPGERELVERARLYLQVCERETARRPSGPQTPTESVYAATVALNAGDVEGALAHLGRALEKAPDSDHAHYIMSVALVDKGDIAMALVHLRHAISLNPENRSVALQDPDLGQLHDLEAFHQAVGAASEAAFPRSTKARR
jgi:tetratricopeptide (TPR) repeat protein